VRERRSAASECFATVLLGDSADMAAIGSGEARLVLTSPPYFGPDAERVLSGPRAQQGDIEAIWREVESFTRALGGVFSEMARVVGTVGVCCIETKDLACGEFRLPLVALHAELARCAGLWVRSSIQFRTRAIKPSHLPAFYGSPEVGNFRSLDASTLLICSHPRLKRISRTPLAYSRTERLALIDPAWRVTAARGRRVHEHQSPPDLVRRVVGLFTLENELVVDPFAGSGQTIRIAHEMGRCAVGYEIDPARHAVAVAGLVSRSPKSRGVVQGRGSAGS
jgi:site-specific DNA-methyltransferase (adenine-specific)